jgi:hypothetical protein
MWSGVCLPNFGARAVCEHCEGRTIKTFGKELQNTRMYAEWTTSTVIQILFNLQKLNAVFNLTLPP